MHVKTLLLKGQKRFILGRLVSHWLSKIPSSIPQSSKWARKIGILGRRSEQRATVDSPDMFQSLKACTDSSAFPVADNFLGMPLKLIFIIGMSKKRGRPAGWPSPASNADAEAVRTRTGQAFWELDIFLGFHCKRRSYGKVGSKDEISLYCPLKSLIWQWIAHILTFVINVQGLFLFTCRYTLFTRTLLIRKLLKYMLLTRTL